MWLTNDDIAVNLCYDILLIKAIQNLVPSLPSPIRVFAQVLSSISFIVRFSARRESDAKIRDSNGALRPEGRNQFQIVLRQHANP